MDELDFVKKLEEDEELFDREYDKLGDFFNLRHYEKVHDFIKDNTELIVLLNELKHRLSKAFPTGKFDLVLNTDYEYSDWSIVVLYVKVDEYTFDNGVMDDINKITFDFIPLRRKLDVLPDFAIWPALYNW
ncbi:hypothetical protein [uncultured Methanobrevibacter sp.]|uniref:hypothetical protein n=1 Tax=uncultured Methanobrevibacter sp. TaxID=253161 RepID=UPI0025DA994F|nr:hypothetical protein [uncultured Methanobrevibacter sp.]